MPQVEKYEAPRLGQVVTLNVGFMERLPSDPYRPVVYGRHALSEQLRDLCSIESIPQPMLSDCEAESRLTSETAHNVSIC